MYLLRHNLIAALLDRSPSGQYGWYTTASRYMLPFMSG